MYNKAEENSNNTTEIYNENISKSEKDAKLNKQCDPINGACYNPLTKTTYPFLINSQLAKDAELFVVMCSTGKYKEPSKYYFDSEEQYLRYKKSRVSRH
jgi:hypothetical protein|tara:strand:- start:61 stop:357 length:297 start_codon:yes stop_codon:yes gene_type:complete